MFTTLMYVSVVRFIFLWSPTFTNYIDATNFYDEVPPKLEWKLDISLFSYGYWKCMLVDSLIVTHYKVS